MKASKIILLSLYLIINTNLVLADEYYGLAFGHSKLSGINASVYNNPITYKGYYGIRTTHIGLEVGIQNLGVFNFKTSDASLNTKITAIDITAIGYLPLNNRFEFFGKVGAFEWLSDSNINNRNISHSGTEMTYGLGAEIKLLPITLRAEYQQFINIGINRVTITTLTLGASILF